MDHISILWIIYQGGVDFFLFVLEIKKNSDICRKFGESGI